MSRNKKSNPARKALRKELRRLGILKGAQRKGGNLR